MDYRMKRDSFDPGADRMFENNTQNIIPAADIPYDGSSQPDTMDAFMRGSVYPAATDQDVYHMDERYFMEQGHLMDPKCFDQNSARYSRQIIDFINGEFSDSIYYKNLSKKARTPNAKKTLLRISADEARHSKMLSGVYFLITGKRYTPTTAIVPPPTIPASYMQALRERYIEESQGALSYFRFAQTVDDVCLKKVAQNLGEDERRHAQEIMELIQSA